MDVLIVVAHHRRNSLTHGVAERFAKGLADCGHRVEWADLVAEGFDPVLREEDEPDWDDPFKPSSEEVRREMRRVERNDATVMIFPVYWWSLPAILKGWIDRVWTNGWAYGETFYPHDRVWMVGVAGAPGPTFAKRGYDTAMQTLLDQGILQYCQIAKPRLELLYDSHGGQGSVEQLLVRVDALAANFELADREGI